MFVGLLGVLYVDAFCQASPVSPTGRIAIIANAAVPIDSISSNQLYDLYTLETNTWKDGSLVVLFDVKSNSEGKKIFYDYLDSSPRDLKQMWMRAILSGEGQSPKIAKSEEELVLRVSQTEGAIGYASVHAVNEGVKIIAVLN